MSFWGQALVVAALAGLVGLGEIVGRYRSDPLWALRHSIFAWLYVAVNAAAGVGALFLIRSFGWTFGQTHHLTLWRILVAGFGAIALFRSSLFVARIGNSDVGVGPSLVLRQLLDFFEREVDRRSATENFPPNDQTLLGSELIKIRNDKTLNPDVRMRTTIFYLARFLSATLVVKVLQDARDIFVARIVAPTPPPDASAVAAVVEEAKKLSS
jgi:hypothetical protein